MQLLSTWFKAFKLHLVQVQILKPSDSTIVLISAWLKWLHSKCTQSSQELQRIASVVTWLPQIEHGGLIFVLLILSVWVW